MRLLQKALESILVKKNIGDGLSSSNNAHSGFSGNGKTFFQEDPKQLEQLFDVGPLKGDFPDCANLWFNVVHTLVQNGLHNVKLVEKLLKKQQLDQYLSKHWSRWTLVTCASDYCKNWP
ncbi:BEM_collapsed_G0058230.mRNA.1.CDS.1 [Saccharomyces cerevisiae]|nr:BEM_collapsed_G0058230.mRNA.1.CDS.1 [Saccharomyces cerevisiae]